MNRRELLQGTLAAATSATVVQGSSAISRSAHKSKIVITGGHPGDPEYGCGGTVARLTALGHEVVLLYLNDGAWETSASVRMAEARRACEILKARPAYANQKNGQAVVDPAHYDAFQNILEAENPDAVFTHWLIDNHADHRAIANMSYESWNRGKRRYALYYYEVSDGEDTTQFPVPSHYVDISGVSDTKKSACYAHASQTPDRYYDLQDTVAKFRGFQNGTQRAEAYIQQLGGPYDFFCTTGLVAREDRGKS